MMHSEMLALSCFAEQWQFTKNACVVKIAQEISRWKERYTWVTNILNYILFRPKRQNRCGMLSHVEVSVHSMMMVVPGRSVIVECTLLSIVAMIH